MDDFKFDNQDSTVNNEGLVFTTPQSSPVYTPEATRTLSKKYAQAFDFDPNYVKQVLDAGDEKSLQNTALGVARQRYEAARSRAFAYANNEDIKQLLTTDLPPITEDTALPVEFANNVVSAFPAYFQTATMAEYTKDPAALDKILGIGADVFTNREVLASVVNKWQPKLKEELVGGENPSEVVASLKNVFKLDFAELFVPFLSWYRFRDVANKMGEANLTSAKNIEELVSSVYRLPFDQAKAKAEEIVQDLYGRNAYDAAVFIGALDAYSTSDGLWDNFGDILNVADIPILYALKKSSRFIRPQGIKMSGVAEAGGDIQQAARYKAVESLEELSRAAGEPQAINARLSNAATFWNPQSVIEPTANLTSRAADRLIRELSVSRDELLTKVLDTVNVKRLDEGTKALAVAYEEAEAIIRNRLPAHYTNGILDVRHLNADVSRLNVAAVEARLGQVTKRAPESIEERIAEAGGVPGARQTEPRTRSLNDRVADARGEMFVRDSTKETQAQKLKAVNDNKTANNKFGKIVAMVPEEGARARDIFIQKAVNDNKIPVEVSIGKYDATLFDTAVQAETHARNYYQIPKGTYNIVEEAPGRFYISVMKQIDETTPRVRQALIDDLRGTDPNDLASLFLQRIGSAETLNSRSMSANRKIAVHGTSDLLDAMAKHLNENVVKELDKEARGRFKAFTTFQRNYESANGEVLGKFSKNQADFETEWAQLHNRLPSVAESKAYWNYVQISDFDWVLRNLSVYTKMSQEGWEMVGLSTKEFKMKVPLIEGKVVTEIPDYKFFSERIALWADNASGITQIKRKDVVDYVAQGYKIVKLHTDGERKLRSIGVYAETVPEYTKYVLVRDPVISPLTFNRVAYRPGGHRTHIDDFFVSAPMIRKSEAEEGLAAVNRYLGDFNISSHMVRSQAVEMIDRLNVAREHLKAGRKTELSNYINNFFPSTFDETAFRNLFTKHGLDLNEPFRLRHRNSSLYDTYNYKETHKNLLKEADNPHKLDETLEDTAYTGQRDINLPSYTFEGSAHNPSIRVSQSRLMDPLSTLAKTLQQNTKGMYMDDMKIKHARDFMSRYGDLLDVPSKEEALLNPVHWTMNASFKKDVVDTSRLASARSYRESIKNFLNIDSDVQTSVRTFRERMLETVYDRFGYDMAERIEPYIMNRLTDPVKFLRSAAFHSKIGLFYVPSFMTQAMQFTTMMGIAGPVRSGEALAWAQYARMMRMASPEVRDSLAKKAGEWGGTATDFKDYYEALKRTGLLTIKGEVAELDDDKAFRVSRSTLGTFLDWGRTPFDQGEKLSRIMAFQIAYREWRAVEKTAALTDDALRTIVNRSDLLTGNMTRASLMTWQKGLASLPTQFFNWHIRMSEQMLGANLSKAEKARLVLSNAILFGVPAGLATAPLLNLLPWKPGIDLALNSQGISPDENGVLNTVLNGGLGAMTKALFGEQFNFNQRFGPGVANPIIETLFDDEQMFITTMTGVAGSTIQDLSKLAVPVIAHIANRIAGNDTDLEWADLKDELDKVVNSLGSAEKALSVINSGKYISKNSKTLAEVDNWKGYVLALTGLQPREIQQAGEKQQYLQAIKGIQKTLEPRMLALHKKMYESGNQEDIGTMNALEKRLRSLYTISGMTPDEILRFEYRAFQDMNKTWIDKTNEALSKRSAKNLQQVIKDEEAKANGR